MRTVLFAIALLAAASCVVIGVAIITPAAGWITAGVLLAGWSYAVLVDHPDPPIDADAVEVLE